MFFFNNSNAQPIDLLSLGRGETAFQREEHWRKKYAGRYVDWTGEVQNVSGSGSGFDSFISIKLADGKMVAYLHLRDPDSWSNKRRLQKLQIDQTIHFRAKLPDCLRYNEDGRLALSLEDGRLK